MIQKRMKGEKKEKSPSDRFFSIDRREIAKKVREIATPLCDDEEIELVHVEYQREPAGKILRVFIDKPGGVTLDDCTAISRQLSDLLDVKFETRGVYSLEVSSPGPNRPLSIPSDFDRYKGRRGMIRTIHGIEGRKNFKGTLMGVIEGRVFLKIEENTVAIPLDKIARAHLLGEDGENTC